MADVIKFDGIEGESKTPGFVGWIDIYGWGWSGGHPYSGVRAGGSSQAEINIQDISITKNIDKASATLWTKMKKGLHFPKVQIAALKTTGNEYQAYLTLDLTEVFIVNLNQQIQGVEVGHETVTMHFKTVVFKYWPQGTSGVLDPNNTFGVNLETYEDMA